MKLLIRMRKAVAIKAIVDQVEKITKTKGISNYLWFRSRFHGFIITACFPTLMIDIRRKVAERN